ncbi:MAG: hypothetical protein AB7I42_29000 [Bradyrhizobium sp.]|uniref:hypothetical protein n=1 Tax=Bradyrhizobium sp. TaxID=376 RepID=UPI003D0B10D9
MAHAVCHGVPPDYIRIDISTDKAYNLGMQTIANERIALVLPSALVRRLDDWRRENTIIPPRAAVLRALIERGLDEIAANPPSGLRRAGRKAPAAG